MHYRHHTVVLVGFLALACAKDDGSGDAAVNDSVQTDASATAAPPAAPPSAKACDILSAEELQAADIDGAGKPSVSGGADVCSWYGTKGSLVVQLFPYASSYEDSRKAFEDLFETKAQDISGVGDKAFYMTGKMSGMETATLSALKGSKAISVQLLAGDASKHKQRVQDLANKILAKL